MAIGETSVTLVGNVTAEPELRFTSAGAAVCSFTVAVQPRKFDKTSNTWQDGEASFYRCSAWRQLAENLAESITRGTRVIVVGTIAQRSYETREGDKRTVFEVQAEDVGISMKFSTATSRKADRSGGESSRPAADPWGAPASAGQTAFNDPPPF